MPRRLPLACAVVMALVVLAAACGGDDGDDQQADTTAANRNDPSDTNDDAGGTDAGDGSPEDDADGDLADITACAGNDTDGTDGTGAGEDEDDGEDDGPSVDIGPGGISVDDGEGGGIDVGGGGVVVEGEDGQVAVGDGRISIEGCFGELDVEVNDGAIVVDGPNGSVTITPGEAVAQLGGEDTEAGISILLADSVLFDFDSAVLRAESGQQLSLIAGLAAAYPESGVEIGGHTDALGDDAYNQQLSEQRAQAVRQALGVLGVADARMTATGFGETQPVAPNTTPDGADDPVGRQQNRRVEVLLAGADL